MRTSDPKRGAASRRAIHAAVALLVTAGLCGCTAREIYNASDGLRRNECNKIGEQEKRDRCLKEEAGRSYDDYRAGTAR